MEKKTSTLLGGSNKKDPSNRLYHIDIECAARERNAQRFAETDAFTEWQTPSVQPKIVITKKKKTKRGRDSNVEGRLMALYNSGSWANSIEKYSYRYVSNNGCYRAIKVQLSHHPKANASQRKPSPTTGLIFSSEQRNLQREITRDLRRQFQTLLETNRTHFRLQPSSATSDYLEDEQDYKDKHSTVIKLGSSAVPAVSESIPAAAGVTDRTLETQSAQPLPVANRVENLLISKRCSTNLEAYKSPLLSGGSLAPPDKSWIKADKPHSKSVPLIQNFNRLHIDGESEVEALVKQTFTTRRGPVEPLRTSKSLGPIEKVTPSLREAYDNSKAVQEIIKLGQQAQSSQPIDFNISAIGPKKVKAEVNSVVSISKPKAVRSTSLGPGVTSNFRTAKLVEAQNAPRLNEMVSIDIDHTSNNFQAFLPSISGKRITTKISSLR